MKWKWPMRAYMKFGAILLAAVGLQVLIDRNRDSVEQAIFVVRTGCVNLIGTEAERQDLIDVAQRMLVQQLAQERERYFQQVLAEERVAARRN